MLKGNEFVHIGAGGKHSVNNHLTALLSLSLSLSLPSLSPPVLSPVIMASDQLMGWMVLVSEMKLFL